MSSHSGQSSAPQSRSSVLHELTEQMLAEGYAVELKVTGASMTPFVCTDDLLTLERLAGEQAQVGDIVIWRVGSKVVIHRVIRRVPTK